MLICSEISWSHIDYSKKLPFGVASWSVLYYPSLLDTEVSVKTIEVQVLITLCVHSHLHLVVLTLAHFFLASLERGRQSNELSWIMLPRISTSLAVQRFHNVVYHTMLNTFGPNLPLSVVSCLPRLSQYHHCSWTHRDRQQNHYRLSQAKLSASQHASAPHTLCGQRQVLLPHSLMF